MPRYYKFINGFMLNFYDLDISEEEALAQGYKTANEPPQDGKQYYAEKVTESEHHIEVEWAEIKIPEPQEAEQ